MDVPPLFIHSSVDGHLGCSHFLSIVNNAAMNISVHIFVWIYVFNSLACIPCCRIVGHTVILCLTFWETAKLFPKWLQQFIFPSASISIPISLHLCQPLLLPSGGYEVVSHYSFDLPFPKDYWCWSSFHELIGHLYIFPGETSIHILWPFFIVLFIYFFIEL